METRDQTITERRRKTRNRIYRYLYEAQDFCSKQTIARDLGLSLPTVYQNISELMNAGLVCYSGEQQSTGGRRAQGLTVVDDAHYAVGISITEDRLRFVASDLRLKEIAYQKVEHEPIVDMPDFGGFMAEELEHFLDVNHLSRKKLLGVGVTLPAVINLDNRMITLAPTLQLRNISLAHWDELIPYPLYIENDATSGGYAEWFALEKRMNMAYLSLENGVGGAVLVNGDQYTGDNRRSGEFGHMCVHPEGLPCNCGKRGCLEAYCSARRISDNLGITLKEFFAGVEQHNPEYEALWDDLLRHLAIGINNVRLALDCDVVVGGFLSEYLRAYWPRLEAYVAANNTFENSAAYLHLSRYQKHAVPLGVALHYIIDFIQKL